MEILPVIFCIALPIVLIIVAFALGRWTASHQITIERRAGQPSPFFENFEER